MRMFKYAWLLLLVGMLFQPVVVGAVVWNVGDLAIGVSGGCYQIRDNTGVLKQTICDGLGGFTTGCSWNNTTTKLYTTNFSANRVVVYDDADPHPILTSFTTSSATN